MKGIFDVASGKMVSLFSDMPLQGSDQPVPGPDQILLELPTTVIAQAVTTVTITTDDAGNPVYTFNVDQSQIELQWNNIRLYRNSLLFESDWTCSVTDYTLPNKNDWIVYRDALRHITSQMNPFTIVWPMTPSSVWPMTPSSV
jgi:hypothetical protein